jgi:antitoxin component YwqK of YwqJK toxin-antitoxin module
LLHFSQNWKEGALYGEYKEFSEDGELTEQLLYKNNLLHGECTYFYPDTAITKHFENGDELVDGEKKGFRFLPPKTIFKSKKDSVNITNEQQ